MRGMGAPFWRLVIAGSTSSLADGINRVVAAAGRDADPRPGPDQRTNDLAFLPWLLFGLLSGAVADRVDRRHAMTAANVMRAAAIGGLGAAVAFGVAGIGLLYAAAFFVGVAETIRDSAARAALPQVVRPEQLEAVRLALDAHPCRLIRTPTIGELPPLGGTRPLMPERTSSAMNDIRRRGRPDREPWPARGSAGQKEVAPSSRRLVTSSSTRVRIRSRMGRTASMG